VFKARYSGLALAAALMLPLVMTGCLCSTVVPDIVTPESPLGFSPATLPDATAGQEYSTLVQATGNKTPVYEIAVLKGTLPPGLSLNYQKGASAAKITGSPRQAGQYTFTLKASCVGTNQAGQIGKAEYTLLVK
jgi:hypothetical protein